MAKKEKRVNRGISKGKSVRVDVATYAILRGMAEREKRSVSSQIAILAEKANGAAV